MARPDGERRFHVEVSAHDLLAGLVDSVLRAAPQRTGEVVLAIRTQLGTEAKQRGNGGGPEQGASMLIDAIL